MNDRLKPPRFAIRRIGASLLFALFSLLLLADMPICAADREARKGDEASSAESKKRREKTSDKEKKTDSTEAEESGEDLFLREGKENQKFLPDIFRCPECGYEQDEPGTCPDHDESVLILVRSKGKNPLEPSEVDGNEDIVVDIPLTGLSLKKAAPASGTVSPQPAPRASGDRKQEEAPQGR